MKWLKTSIIVIVFIIIIIIGLIFFRKNSVNREATPEVLPNLIGTEVKTRLVNDDTYFSIDACVNKMIKFAQANVKDAIYNILNKDFLLKNNITADNVFEVTKLNNITKYKTIKIYEINRIKNRIC